MFDAILFPGIRRSASSQAIASAAPRRRRVFSSEVSSAAGRSIRHSSPSAFDYDGTSRRARQLRHALDVIGGGSADFVSADWPGIMEQAVAGVYGDEPSRSSPTGPVATSTTASGARPASRVRARRGHQMGRTYAGLAVAAIEVAGPWRDRLRLEDLVPYYTRDEAMAEIEAMARDDLGNSRRPSSGHASAGTGTGRSPMSVRSCASAT